MSEVAVASTQVRFASALDRGAIWELLVAMGGHDDLRERSLESFAALLAASDGRVLVAERDGAVAGVATLQARLSLLSDRREAWLGALAVAPQMRSIGIGAALLAAVEREAAALGCASIVLEASTMREAAHAFYHANGFTEVRSARRFERAVEAPGDTLAERFLAAAARAAARVAFAVAGRADASAVGIGADGAATEDADEAAEQAALAELLPLGLPIVSEEAGLVGASRVDPDAPWISLDPLDGSRNFVAGFPMYATSIGLVQSGRALAGFVADLAGGRRWAARAGCGATLDGRPIRTRRSVLGAIPSPLPGTTTLRALPGITRVRISGSTASDLARVADGTFAAFFALDRPVVHVHDLAAAMIVLEEAGGCVIDRAGERPVLVPDPAVCLDVVAACDRAFALQLAGLA
jgi:fructose-1,6-bisphosphatase/inositol monophosphatase family enzyme/N-acetylglutamate synthase-like GNAT family acetyltransferase